MSSGAQLAWMDELEAYGPPVSSYGSLGSMDPGEAVRSRWSIRTVEPPTPFAARWTEGLDARPNSGISRCAVVAVLIACPARVSACSFGGKGSHELSRRSNAANGVDRMSRLLGYSLRCFAGRLTSAEPSFGRDARQVAGSVRPARSGSLSANRPPQRTHCTYRSWSI